MLVTGIITTYLISRLLVVSGFINIYPDLGVRQPSFWPALLVQFRRADEPAGISSARHEHPAVVQPCSRVLGSRGPHTARRHEHVRRGIEYIGCCSDAGDEAKSSGNQHGAVIEQRGGVIRARCAIRTRP